MTYQTVIRQMKAATFAEAEALAIPVANAQGEAVGKLVPVGAWLLDDREKIELISGWRKRAMRMFLTQFESTYEKAHGYLKNLSVAQENRLLFLMYDDAGRFVGHMGLADVNGISGELDNFMRGVDGGNPNLVFLAELALLDWAFGTLGLQQSVVSVLSYNWLTVQLHEEVGFTVTENLPLKKSEADGVVTHATCTAEEANVKYAYTKLALQKAAFYAKFGWLQP